MTSRLTPEEIKRMNEERRTTTMRTFAVPFLYAPLLPLIRVSLGHNPPLRDRAFGAAIAVALAHAGYIMSSDSSVL